MPSAPSTACDRCTASSAENSTATQNSPAAARVRTPRSGSRAKAKSTTTSTANGTICCSATRERASMRRSLPATSSASRNTKRLLFPAQGAARALHLSPGDGDRSGRQRAGAIELVAGDEDGGPGGDGGADLRVECVAPGSVEAGVRLVE